LLCLESSNTEKPHNEYIARLFEFLVTPSGEMSNFLLKDFEAVVMFMNAENQKKKLRL
jgi:hypothetical protein